MLPAATASISLLKVLRGGARQTAPSSPVPASASSSLQQGSNLIDKLYNDLYQMPEAFRFFLSGNIGNVVFFGLERCVHAILQHNLLILPTMLLEYQDGVSFLVAYMLQVISQHWLHAYLVYGMHTISTREKYLKTLVACYSTYMVSMVGSTILNTTLIKWGVERTLSFFSTLTIFACLNYAILKYMNEHLVDDDDDTNDATTSKSNDRKQPEVRGGGALSFRGGASSFFDLHDFVVSTGVPVQLPGTIHNKKRRR